MAAMVFLASKLKDRDAGSDEKLIILFKFTWHKINMPLLVKLAFT